MAKREYSSYQQGLIKRYYDNRSDQALIRLGELATELYLAKTDKKRDQLWGRVAKAMDAIKVPKPIAQYILQQRKPEILAGNLEDWLKKK